MKEGNGFDVVFVFVFVSVFVSVFVFVAMVGFCKFKIEVQFSGRGKDKI